MEHEGGCLCGAIRFEIGGRISDVGQCHCSVCRKASGTGCTAVAVTASRSFRWLSGEDRATRFARPSGWSTSFCGVCGSPLPVLHENGKVYMVPAGLLDGSLELAVGQHIFVDSKASWDVIGDDAPRYAEFADGD